MASFPTVCKVIEVDFDLHRALAVQKHGLPENRDPGDAWDQVESALEEQFICVASVLSNNQLKLFLSPGVLTSIKVWERGQSLWVMFSGFSSIVCDEVDPRL